MIDFCARQAICESFQNLCSAVRKPRPVYQTFVNSLLILKLYFPEANLKFASYKNNKFNIKLYDINFAFLKMKGKHEALGRRYVKSGQGFYCKKKIKQTK